MQTESSLRPPAPTARWRRSYTATSRRTLVRAAGVLLGGLFLLSVVFDESFLRAGVTPASILLAAVLVGFSVTCGRDPLHPARILAVLLAISFVIGPIVHALTGVYSLPDGSERQEARLSQATWMVLAGATLAMLAMRITLSEDWSRDLQRNAKRISRRTLTTAVGVAACGVALLIAYLFLTGGSFSLQGRGATYTVIRDEGRKAYLGLLAPIGIGGLLVIAAWALERRSRVTLISASTIAVGFGLLMALPGGRANFLYAIAPLFFLYAAFRGLPRWQWLVAGSLVLIVALSYAASLRTADTRAALVHEPWRTLSETGPNRQNMERLFVVDVAHTESLLGAMDAYPATRPFLGGESAALGTTGPLGWKFGRLIGLHMDPPAGVTVTAAAYARDPSTFSSGVTATAPGELYANAGVPGVVFGLAAFGAILGWVRRFAVSSRAAGMLALYASAITMLFAVFADYFGEFYRGGMIVIGVGLALLAGRQSEVRFMRVTLLAFLVGAAAAGLLLVHKFAGAPSSALLKSNLPVYLTLAAISIFVAVRATRFFPRHEKSRE
jgi:hypothetical protein